MPPVVLEISSDEEEGLEQSLTAIDYSWIRDILSDDSDEVEVIEEKKPTLVTKNMHDDDDDDDEDEDDEDDCIILEGDPEKGASVVEEATDSDELLVIGEKGPIACRDYPHARHLCATFPFSSTPHERHCSQCHCYVCDSIAPCLKWGTGSLGSDHCHANDKTEQWKIQRKTSKLGQSSPVPASTNFGTSLEPGNLQSNEFQPPGIIRLSPNSVLPSQVSRSTALHTISSLNSIPHIQTSLSTITRPLSTSSPNSSVQNQISRPINTTTMSTGTNITVPNGANLGRSQESRSTLMINRYQPHSVSRPVLSVRSHPIQKERGNSASNLRPQLLRPHMSKGADSAGNTLMTNNSSQRSSAFNSHVNMTQHPNYHNAARFPNYGNCIRPYQPTNIPFYLQQSSEPASLSCVNQHTVASETQANTQPLPQPNDSQDFHQTCIQVNDGTLSSYAPCLNENEPQIRSQDGNADGNTAQFGTASQDTSQPQPHVEPPMETVGSFSAFDSCWNDNTGQSILQSSGSANGAPPAGSHAPLIEYPQLSNSLVDFESWLFERNSFPAVTNEFLSSDPLSPDPIIPSPNLDSDDMGNVLHYLDGD
ncbi:uncharacterized protein LOC109809690 [Cajanus cajan]|uniref:uncharacterized protein LOC109809690 n=1 Tax=Cajanus cajan TaxID=3821 RepID=UPI00098D98C5|nr:uncharacterized protein LOC109809690 [Cajanus cajan]